MRRSANIHMKVQPQLFRTTTGIQSGPDASQEQRSVMTFLTIFRAQRYAATDQFWGGKLKKLSRVLRKDFCKLIRCKTQQSSTIKEWGSGRFIFTERLTTIYQKSREPGFLEVLDSLVLSAKQVWQIQEAFRNN